VALALVAVVACLAGWLGYRAWQSAQEDHRRAAFVETARAEGVNLTTVSYTEIDADVKRIVDAATGSFRDDFQHRAPAFVEVVKKAQSKSVGTVTLAGVETLSGDQAQVLVAMSVKTFIAGVQDQQPRLWRMRITVDKTSDGAKVSDVVFVP
jgi:Mce-associated membrane protein